MNRRRLAWLVVPSALTTALVAVACNTAELSYPPVQPAEEAGPCSIGSEAGGCTFDGGGFDAVADGSSDASLDGSADGRSDGATSEGGADAARDAVTD